MGQIVGLNAKCKRANLNALSLVPTPAAGEHILVSSDNSMNAAGQGNFDCYIEGDGQKAAAALELKKISLDINDVRDLYIDKYTYLDLENVSGWKNNNAVNLIAGHTYNVTITNSGSGVLTYFRAYDGDGTQSQPLSIPNSRVTGIFTTEYTPEVDIVKVDFYSGSAGRCVITEANANKVLLTHDDIVDNLNEGGTDVPLSAEQGKELNKDVSIFNKYTIPLSHGTINNSRYSERSLINAKGIIENNGFSTLEVKDGYEYIIYGSDSAVYGTGSTTTIVGTYTSEPYVNDSALHYFWVCVKRSDGANIPIEDLTNIVILTDKTSVYNFKTINDVGDYYKYAKEIDITEYDYISGEGFDINYGTKSGTTYERTSVFEVTNYDAIKIYYNSYYDDSAIGKKIGVCWFDESNNVVGTTQIILETKDSIAIIGVPHHAKYASVDTSSVRFKIYGLRHEKTAADAHYYNTSKCEIGKLEDVTLILCCGQSLMVGGGAPGISYEETYFPLRQLGYLSNEIKCFARLVNSKGSLGYEKPDRGIGEMFVESIAKENGISIYANEWERHLIVLVNCAIGGSTIAELTDDTLYQEVTKAITSTKTLCDKFGLTMAAPAWVWMQGEQDIKAAMSSADYKTALLAYQDKICNSLSTIAGITKRPKCCIYQPSSQCLYSQTYNFVNPYLEFNNAYVELLRDNDEFIACVPAYIFDGSNSSDNNEGFVHLNARSYKTLGAYAGYSIKKAIIDGMKVKGVIPIDITVDGTTINIKYNVPCPPLKFDTEWVKEPPLTNGVHNYGFNVVKSDDTELITNVSVFDDTVTIECSESPIGAKLRYGLNGDRIHMQNSEYWGIDGRIHGGRGNLRDSQGDYVQKEIRELGQTMRLDNWAYCFEELLTEPTGE